LSESLPSLRIASLPMYDYPELHAAHDALWAAIRLRLRARGIGDTPDALTRSADLFSMWRNPALLLGQTCGHPQVTGLGDKVQVIATPIYLRSARMRQRRPSQRNRRLGCEPRGRSACSAQRCVCGQCPRQQYRYESVARDDRAACAR
jgi:hypothetical protein